MAFMNKYPYTDFHELNLDWLLTTYKNIVDDLKGVHEWITTHQGEYEDAMRRLEAVENEIDTFETEIERRFAELEAEVQQLIIDTRQEIEDIIAQFRQEIEQIKNEFLQLIAQMREEIRRMISSIQAVLDANNEYIMEWVEIRFQEFIDNLPDYEHVVVYNPYRGIVTTLQEAIADLYTIASTGALTAAQYDMLQLTASEYDALDITAMQYDTQGYRLLYPDPDHFMMSPFTGSYVPIKTVVYELADLHRDALTATDYDALLIEASTYDNMEITAYNYDWNGNTILTA